MKTTAGQKYLVRLMGNYAVRFAARSYEPVADAEATTFDRPEQAMEAAIRHQVPQPTVEPLTLNKIFPADAEWICQTCRQPWPDHHPHCRVCGTPFRVPSPNAEPTTPQKKS